MHKSVPAETCLSTRVLSVDVDPLNAMYVPPNMPQSCHLRVACAATPTECAVRFLELRISAGRGKRRKSFCTFRRFWAGVREWGELHAAGCGCGKGASVGIGVGGVSRMRWDVGSGVMHAWGAGAGNVPVREMCECRECVDAGEFGAWRAGECAKFATLVTRVNMFNAEH